MNLVCGPRKRRCFLLPVGTPYGLWSTHIFFALILVREKWLKNFFIIIFFFITKALLLFLIYFSRRFFTRKWNKHPIDNKWNNPHRSNLQNCNLLIRRWHIAPTLKPLDFYFSFLFFLLPFFDGSTFPFLFAQSNQRGLFAFWLKCRWTCQIQFSFTPHQFICQTKDCIFFLNFFTDSSCVYNCF